MPWAQGRSAALTLQERAAPPAYPNISLWEQHLPGVWAQGTALCLMKKNAVNIFFQRNVHTALKKTAVWPSNFLIFSSSTSATTAPGLKRLEGCRVWGGRLASEHVVLKGCLEETAAPPWITSLRFLSKASDPSHSSPSSKESPICALPWARQRTTSRHSGCALAGSPPRGPCTRWSHRTSTRACRGRWPPCSDQSLHKLKQKNTRQVTKNHYLSFCLLRLFEQNTPSSRWRALSCPCAERGCRHTHAGALPQWHLLMHPENRHIIFTAQNELLAQGRREFK